VIDRRKFVLGSMLAASGGVAFAVKPWRASGHAGLPDLEALMLPALGPWTAGAAQDVILANPVDLGVAFYDALAVRHYRSARQPDVTVLIAYGQAQSYATQLHRPELCYPASGFAIRARSRTLLPFEGGPVPAQTLVARRKGRTDEILFWARIGNSFTQGVWDQRFAIARGALISRSQDGMLIRLSVTNSADGKGARALEDFANRFVDAQNDMNRALLIGPRHASLAAGRSPRHNTPQKK
jgi:EpsI family protein